MVMPIVGAIGEAGRDLSSIVQILANRAARPCIILGYTVHPEHNRDQLRRSLLQVPSHKPLLLLICVICVIYGKFQNLKIYAPRYPKYHPHLV